MWFLFRPGSSNRRIEGPKTVIIDMNQGGGAVLICGSWTVVVLGVDEPLFFPLPPDFFTGIGESTYSNLRESRVKVTGP